jgi:hypothetical protein
LPTEAGNPQSSPSRTDHWRQPGRSDFTSTIRILPQTYHKTTIMRSGCIRSLRLTAPGRRPANAPAGPARREVASPRRRGHRRALPPTGPLCPRGRPLRNAHPRGRPLRDARARRGLLQDARPGRSRLVLRPVPPQTQIQQQAADDDQRDRSPSAPQRLLPPGVGVIEDQLDTRQMNHRRFPNRRGVFLHGAAKL